MTKNSVKKNVFLTYTVKFNICDGSKFKATNSKGIALVDVKRGPKLCQKCVHNLLPFLRYCSSLFWILKDVWPRGYWACLPMRLVGPVDNTMGSVG